jgi:hypothetical protein
MMMKLLKDDRIEKTKDILNKVIYEIEADQYTIRALMDSLDDSENDRDNYDWIAKNYKEYQEL